MDILIKQADSTDIALVNKCNGEFVVNSRIKLYIDNEEIKYTVHNLEEYKKQYKDEVVSYNEYINSSNKAIFLAFLNDLLVGQSIIKNNWNNYAYVEDIRVDYNFRGHGIGKKIIEEVKTWAKKNKLMGIMLETQDVNVAACIFYEKCGFKIGGFDRYLYKGIPDVNSEVAIFWYYNLNI